MPYAFDALISIVYAPLGRLRELALDELGVTSGTRVLELGCGTGGITRRMLRRGARVTALDRSESMLRIARRRAPGAELLRRDLRNFESARRFERVLLAFVLHEVSSGDRVESLRLASENLLSGGVLGVLDVAAPTHPVVGAAWRAFVNVVEPPSAVEVLDGALEEEIARAGLEVIRRLALAGGRAQMITARLSEAE